MKRHALLFAICALLTSACNQDVSPVAVDACGNNILNAGEECDGSVFGAKTCVDYKGAGATGLLKCTAECRIDESSCTAAEPQLCGNTVIDAGEECDGTLFGAKTCKDYKGEDATGSLTCTKDCRIDDTQCIEHTPELCGNSTIDPGEECDGEAFGAKTCEDYQGKDAIGSLLCTEACIIDSTACTPAPLCGNNVIDPGEECDGEAFGAKTCEDYQGKDATGSLLCTETCAIDSTACIASPLCGNDVIDPSEECDGKSFGAKTCEDYQGKDATGSLLCTNTCIIDSTECKASPLCGNDVIDPGEECDGKSFGAKTCEDYQGKDATGSLLCTNTCIIDSTQCAAAPLCGNHVINADEECDDQTFGAKTCADYKGEGATGALVCTPKCTIDSTQCVPAPLCGNDKLDEYEECDGELIPETAACEDGYTPTCSDECKVKCVAVSSVTCGNGQIDENEECDGDILPETASCSEEGLTPACSSECKVTCVVAPISATCGNGQIDENEECDGTHFPENTALCNEGETYSCNEQCRILCLSTSTEASTCGNGQIDEGEECDGGILPETATCEDGSTQSCNEQCQLNPCTSQQPV